MILFEIQILFAVLLDLLIGDPRGYPHPVRIIGWLARKLEHVSTSVLGNTRLAGTVCLIGVLGITVVTTWALLSGVAWLGQVFVFIVGACIIYTTIAVRDLAHHSRVVYNALAADDLPLARKRVSFLVGRDPEHLDRDGIILACVESVAESMVDGACAPLFYAALGGPAGPIGAMLYRATNTLDSMFGYKNEKYKNFGWASARFDDLLNYLPARITGVFLAGASLLLGLDWRTSWRVFRRDRLNHASPNSAHTEAAMAGALGIRLGGPHIYFGETVTKPYIGEDMTNIPSPDMILTANRLLYCVTFLFIIFLVVLCIGFRLM